VWLFYVQDARIKALVRFQFDSARMLKLPSKWWPVVWTRALWNAWTRYTTSVIIMWWRSFQRWSFVLAHPYSRVW